MSAMAQQIREFRTCEGWSLRREVIVKCGEPFLARNRKNGRWTNIYHSIECRIWTQQRRDKGYRLGDKYVEGRSRKPIPENTAKAVLAGISTDRLLKLYEKHSVPEMAQLLGPDLNAVEKNRLKKSIWRRLKKAGYTARSSGEAVRKAKAGRRRLDLQKFDPQKMVELLSAGHSRREIAQKMNCSYPTVYVALHKMGLPTGASPAEIRIFISRQVRANAAAPDTGNGAKPKGKRGRKPKKRALFLKAGQMYEDMGENGSWPQVAKKIVPSEYAANPQNAGERLRLGYEYHKQMTGQTSSKKIAT